MVAVLAAHVGELQHPLLRRPPLRTPPKRIVLLVITSNRGLVGAYNSNVLRMASDFIRRREAENIAVEVHVTGNKGVAYFAFHGRPLAQRYGQSGDLPTLADVEAIATRFADRFTSGQIDSVHVAYTNFVSAAVHRPELLTLLPMAALTGAAAGTDGQPLTSPGKTGSAVMYDFSPDPNILLSELLPPTLKAACSSAISTRPRVRMRHGRWLRCAPPKTPTRCSRPSRCGTTALAKTISPTS